MPIVSPPIVGDPNLDSWMYQVTQLINTQLGPALDSPSVTEQNFTNNFRGKIEGVESFADVTDTSNVTAAGALMDSEVVNLADVKAFDPADYATADDGGKAKNALLRTGGNMTGAITTNSTFDGRNVATDGTKLDGIEASATADQSDAEIRTAVEAATDSNVFTDADHTKLNAIEASADVTDTLNVEAAGAVMDSEVVNLVAVKAFDPADYATAAQGTTADGALLEADVVNLVAVKAFDPTDYATAAQGTTADGALQTTGGTLTGTLDVTTVDFGDWTITESAGSLYFATGGVNKMKLLATGDLEITGNLSALATIT